jgi:predicted Zn-dependent protease
MGFWALVVSASLAACQPQAADFALTEPAPRYTLAAAGGDPDSEKVRRVSDRVIGAAQALCRKMHGAAIGSSSCSYSVVLERSPNVFASTNGQRIRISSGFVDYTATDAELAFIIAHEAAHNLRAHSPVLSSDMRYRQELEADQIGLELLAVAGYESAAALELLDRLSRSNVFAAYDPAYPSFSTRSELLRRRAVELYETGRAMNAASGTAIKHPRK